jgi:carbamoylphosphate synthase small subunit
MGQSNTNQEEKMTQATLALEDGTILQGISFGAAADAVFELVLIPV